MSWVEEFFVVEQPNGSLCLICDSQLRTLKRSNISDHYAKHQQLIDAKYPPSSAARSSKLSLLKMAKFEATKQFKQIFKPDINANGLLASLKVSWILAKAKKLYCDVDIIQDACKSIIQSIMNGPELK